MRVVSLNLDADDAASIRRALAGAITACACGDGADGRPCPDCEALAAAVSDLDRLLSGPPPRRAAPCAAALAAPFVAAGYASTAVGAGERGFAATVGPGGVVGGERRLWVVPGLSGETR